MLHRRPAGRRSRTLLGIGLVATVLTGLTGLWATANAAGAAYFVSPSGADTNPGTSAAAPFKTVQKALDLSAAGSTITLAPGVYRESIVTKTAGTATSPITIKGPETGKSVGGRYQAVLASKGTGGYVVAISHSNYVLDGFTIDGQPNIARTEYPASLSDARGFKDSVQGRAINTKLVYVGADVASRDITGTRIANMFLNGAGGECVRFRNRAAASLVVDSVIQWCGMLASGDDSSKYKYHNSEGVYVGTSPKSTDQPLYANDTSNGVVVRTSVINTFGGECFDVKENAHHNRIEDSECGFNDEPLSFKGSNIELRGDHNLVRRTTVHDSRSWNVKMASDAAQYDKGGNSIQLSSFSGAAAAAWRSEQSTTGSTFCANTFATTPYSEGPSSVGDPRKACSGIDTSRPTAAITSPANGAAVAGTVPITVDAADNAAVTKVEFVVDGAPIGTDTAAPWSQDWTVPTAPGPHTITVTAYDAADNAAVPARVDVTGGTGTTPPPTTSATATSTVTSTGHQHGHQHARPTGGAVDRLRGGVRQASPRRWRSPSAAARRAGGTSCSPAGRARAGSPTASPPRSPRPTCWPTGRSPRARRATSSLRPRQRLDAGADRAEQRAHGVDVDQRPHAEPERGPAHARGWRSARTGCASTRSA
jgi:hypothetical protein